MAKNLKILHDVQDDTTVGPRLQPPAPQSVGVDDSVHPNYYRRGWVPSQPKSLKGAEPMKKILILTIILSLITANIYAVDMDKNGEQVNLLLIYNQASNDYLDIYQNYKQSLIANLNIEATSLNELNKIDLNNYSGIYLDPNIIGDENFNNIKGSIIDYVKKGGHIFLEDKFYSEFPFEFIGASDFKELEEFPSELSFPNLGENPKGLQDTIKLLHKDIVKYFDEPSLNKLNKGHGFHASTATSLVKHGDLTLYGINQYGKGSVLFANSLLPNSNYITGFDMLSKDEGQQSFSFTFATANYLFRNEFASYISKANYGYSIKKVLGTYGRPAMAWQNHFEVGSALREGSMEKWIDVLKEYNQIPSYSLARSLYEWGVWKESVIYHKNIGIVGQDKFQGEEANSHYSSGEHLMTNSDYVALNQYPEAKDLASKIDLPYRAYPTIGDLDHDGIRDIVSGSSDGYIYYFKGISHNQYEDKVKLTDSLGNPINVGTYSAPVFVDINNNNKLDIIVGSGKGTVELYANNGNNTFNKATTISAGQDLNNTTPTIGDIDGDGVLDLIVGESKGSISVHNGRWANATLTFNNKGITLKAGNNTANLGQYPAPSIGDIDGDGKLELIIGDSTGYLKEYTINYPNIEFKGYIEGESLNTKGDRRLWGGYYSVPVLRDINQDGLVDIIVGQIEFGLPIAIDSDIFPYKEDLKRSLQIAQANHIEMYPHVYFQPYKSSSLEEKELELHKKAFEAYGLSWDDVGVNQHTWNINNLNPRQSLQNEEKSGIRWNSGFRPSLKAGEPSLSRDYLWSVPFRLAQGEDLRDFILFSPGPNIPILDDAYESISQLDLPISYFYHMEYGVNTENGLKSLRQKAESLNEIRNIADYNFMMEDQMFKAFEANMKAKITINKNVTINRYEFIIKTNTQDIKDNPYGQAVGIKLEIGDRFEGSKLNTDSKIYHRDGNNLYIGLEDTTKVYISNEMDSPHITRVNGPVKIEETIENGNTKIHFNYQGLQQIKLYSPKGLELISGDDFEIESQGEYIILTRYGDKTILEVKLY